MYDTLDVDYGSPFNAEVCLGWVKKGGGGGGGPTWETVNNILLLF